MKPLPGSRIAGWARKRSGLQGRSGSGPIRCEPDQQERTSDAEPGDGPVRWRDSKMRKKNVESPFHDKDAGRTGSEIGVYELEEIASCSRLPCACQLSVPVKNFSQAFCRETARGAVSAHPARESVGEDLPGGAFG